MVVRRHLDRRRRFLAGAVLLAAGALAGCTGGAVQIGDGSAVAEEDGGTLQKVRERDRLICGVNDEVPGFGYATEDGEFQGFDIDFCRAIAAAVLDDPAKVEFKVLSTEDRLEALRTGEVDVLIRNTTWTAARDGGDGATFLTTTFYDGQGMMVWADSPYDVLSDLRGTTICVLSGTTTELNLEAAFRARGLSVEPLPLKDNEEIREAFQQGRCEGWTSDKSQLAAARATWPPAEGGPRALRILNETFSKEPLGPAVRDGDSQWAQVVDWVVIATMQAEEFGITSTNVDRMIDHENPDIARFLGTEHGHVFDPRLGLPPDFAVKVLRAVGNYGEIYARNLGPNTTLGLERGLNALWKDGGLHYPPPYR